MMEFDINNIWTDDTLRSVSSKSPLLISSDLDLPANDFLTII